MKISARNTLPGIVRKIEPGAVNAEVTIELAPNLNIISIITLDAVKSLKLKPGDAAYAVIKASSVMIGTD
ncbi:MAG: molybdopterin-binding protein [Steroidobacteraceae bacterium]